MNVNSRLKLYSAFFGLGLLIFVTTLVIGISGYFPALEVSAYSFLAVCIGLYCVMVIEPFIHIYSHYSDLSLHSKVKLLERVVTGMIFMMVYPICAIFIEYPDLRNILLSTPLIVFPFVMNDWSSIVFRESKKEEPILSSVS